MNFFEIHVDKVNNGVEESSNILAATTLISSTYALCKQHSPITLIRMNLNMVLYTLHGGMYFRLTRNNVRLVFMLGLTKTPRPYPSFQSLKPCFFFKMPLVQSTSIWHCSWILYLRWPFFSKLSLLKLGSNSRDLVQPSLLVLAFSETSSPLTMLRLLDRVEHSSSSSAKTSRICNSVASIPELEFWKN